MAMLVGAIGGVICVLGMRLLEKMKIDDAIGVVPTHLFSGIWGTLAVALAPMASWDTGLSRAEQFFVQIFGIIVIGAYSFLVGFILLYIINHFFSLRVTADEECIELNISEHGASSSILDLITQMDQQARSGDFSKPVNVEPESEAAHIAMFYNGVLEGFNTETSRRQTAIHELAQLANFDTLTGLANRRVYFEAVKLALSRAKRNSTNGAVFYMDLDGFKRINDNLGHEAGDKLLKEISIRMSACIRDTDVLARIGGDEFGLLLEDIKNTQQVKIVADKIIETVSSPMELVGQLESVSISIGIQLFSAEHNETQASIVKKSDHAMYAVKLKGKGNFHFYTTEDDDI